MTALFASTSGSTAARSESSLLARRDVQVPAVRLVLFWRHCTKRRISDLLPRGLAVSPAPPRASRSLDHPPWRRCRFECGCPASRPPGLRRAACVVERGRSSAAVVATVSRPRAPGHLFGSEDGNACGWTRTNERACARFVLSEVPLPLGYARVRPTGFEPAILSCIRRVRWADHKSAAMPGYATGARLAAEPATSRPSCRPPASPRPSTDCPARIRTGNSWSKARWDC